MNAFLKPGPTIRAVEEGKVRGRRCGPSASGTR